MPDSLHSSLLTSRRTCSDKLEMRAGSFVCSSKALSLLDTLPNISHKHCSAGRSCCTHRTHQALMNKALPCVTLLRAGKGTLHKALGTRPVAELALLVLQPHYLGSSRKSQLSLGFSRSPTKHWCSFLHKNPSVQLPSPTWTVSIS